MKLIYITLSVIFFNVAAAEGATLPNIVPSRSDPNYSGPGSLYSQAISRTAPNSPFVPGSSLNLILIRVNSTKSSALGFYDGVANGSEFPGSQNLPSMQLYQPETIASSLTPASFRSLSPSKLLLPKQQLPILPFITPSLTEMTYQSE